MWSRDGSAALSGPDLWQSTGNPSLEAPGTAHPCGTGVAWFVGRPAGHGSAGGLFLARDVEDTGGPRPSVSDGAHLSAHMAGATLLGVRVVAHAWNAAACVEVSPDGVLNALANGGINVLPVLEGVGEDGLLHAV